MWAETINLAIGDWNLGARPDSDRMGSMLRKLLRAYVSDAGVRMPSNFSLRRPAGLFPPRRGTLYIGGVVAGRSRSSKTLIRWLAGHLSGIQTNGHCFADIQPRVFARGDKAVLVSLRRPELVDDRVLLRRGIEELHIWLPVIDTARRAIVPPQPLSLADWRAAGLKKPAFPAELEIVGFVLTGEEHQRLRRSAFDPDDTTRSSVNLVYRLEDEARVSIASDAVAVRVAIIAAFG